jgi:ankyrin repeat protein
MLLLVTKRSKNKVLHIEPRHLLLSNEKCTDMMEKAWSLEKKNCLNILIENKARLHNFNKFNNSALHDACYYNCPEAVANLIMKTKKTEIKNCLEMTPLHLAAQAGNAGIVQMLIENNADPNCRDYRLQTPLHHAAFWSQC